MQEMVSFDVDWDYMAGLPSGNRCAKHGAVGNSFLFVCWSTSPVMSPLVGKAPLLLVPATVLAQSLLSTYHPCSGTWGYFIQSFADPRLPSALIFQNTWSQNLPIGEFFCNTNLC